MLPKLNVYYTQPGATGRKQTNMELLFLSNTLKGVYDGKKLKAGYDTDIGALMDDFCQDVTNDIQQTRQEVRDKLTLVDNVETWFTGAKNGFLIAHGNRIADQSDKLIDFLTNLHGDIIKTRSRTLPNGRVYNEIDTAATMAASSIAPGSAKERQMLAEWATWTNEPETTAGLSDDKETSIRHHKILNTLSTTMSRLLSAPDC